ncbi:hypothetical protein [Streptomyces sp. NPDC007369]|uniref:hypothetical protein n=1 Tax=Streptomyces sp. NPDC007369 TaxID=3154589 RepID=UPI0033CFCD9D
MRTLRYAAGEAGARDGVRVATPDGRALYEALGWNCRSLMASPASRAYCGGLVPVPWCAEHGDAVGPVLEWHPRGGLRCAQLAQ